MPAGDPIRLGSATGTTLIFEANSTVTTSDSGIQSCSVKALYPDGQNVFNAIPAAGTPFSSVFGNSYLPSNFLVDYTEGGAGIEYLEGRVARVTITFKRQDPTQTNTRKIFVDSTLNYNSPLVQQTLTFLVYSGGSVSTASAGGTFSPMGFPDPIVTVKYSSSSRPSIGAGGLSQLYALPGSQNAQGFPDTPTISIPVSIPIQVGATVTYFDGTEFQTVGPFTHTSTMNSIIEYRPNSLGWQLTRLKSDPQAAANFWDVEEEWRTTYFFFRVVFVSFVPPP